MTDEPRPPAETTADHEADAEPTLGGEVHPDPRGPADISPPERYGPADVLPSTGHETDGESRRDATNESESRTEGDET